jgi:flagellar basal body-associated protein FliL
MSDNTPTERFESVAPHGTPATKNAAVPRPLLIALVAVGSLLLIAVVVLIISLSSKTGTPIVSAPIPSVAPSVASSPSESPSQSGSESAPATPSAEPTETAAPPSTAPAFSTFTAPKTEDDCYYSEAPNFTPPPVHVKVAWKAVNAASVWFIQGTDDAADAQFLEVPIEGNQDDFPYPIDFACNSGSNTYTMTMVGTDGSHKSKTWKVKNTGDRY